MKFATNEEYTRMWEAVHSGILYWKKVRQMCQGKIWLYVDPNQENHYSEQYAIDEMISAAKALRAIELSTRPEWNEETQRYEIVTPTVHTSAIITACLRLETGESEE